MPKYHRAVSVVTEELYNEIKAVVKTTRDYRKGRKLFGVSETTMRKIKNTRDFAEYRQKASKSYLCKAEASEAPSTITDLDIEELVEVRKEIASSRSEIIEAIDEVKIVIVVAAVILGALILLMTIGRGFTL